MRKLPLLFLLFFTSGALFLACKKVDRLSEDGIAVDQRFFTVPFATPSMVKEIAKGMLRENTKAPFITNFVKNNGYALWQRAKVISKHGSTGSRTTNGDSEVSFIPFQKTVGL